MEAIECDRVLGGDVLEANGAEVIFERGGEGVHLELNSRFKFSACEFFACGVFVSEGA